MKLIYKEHLFEKGYLVCDQSADADDVFEVLFSLASLFNIRIVSGQKLARRDMIAFASEQLGVNVPQPFYRGFPQTVREMSPDLLLFDQLLHYTKTYGLGMFEEAGYSYFEPLFERVAFREKTAIRDYVIITEDEAYEKLNEIVGNLLLGSRPLNDSQYAVVLEYVKEFDPEIERCVSKNTAIRLLADSRNLRFVRFLSMSDVIKLVDEINYRCYQNENIKKLNLKNQDRKFITAVINGLFEARRCDIETCCEKKAIWCGLLHHIHYQPHDELSMRFVACMRGKENLSAYARFEKALSEQDVSKAAAILRAEKSEAAVLRNLSYLISRCRTPEEAASVADSIRSDNVVVLIQLLLHFSDRSCRKEKRDFIFTKYNRLKIHSETDAEAEKRRSFVPERYADLICAKIRENLCNALKGRLGKVYIDPGMRSIALPLQENASQGGVGVLPKGSRIAIEPGKKIRAFTYWEKVNDIDLSVIGLCRDGRQAEFSWRTMYRNQSAAITFSGDQTSGFHGGSEYFDIDVTAFRKAYPDMTHLIFCDNVYSAADFNSCYCKAGYMTREIDDSGEVFEPKTVRSSFLINCDSTFAYLFAIDLEKNEFIWLNAARQSAVHVAGATSLQFLTRYFDVVPVINMYTFFEMAAAELVSDPAEADVVVSDNIADHTDSAEIIRSCDFDKVLALMN